MLGFSTALALPFTVFALFPSALKSLPKSGGWLNSVKVVLGFIELAFSLKFLSNVDLAYHWDWFDREVFLSLWIAIGVLLALYLIGKIKFAYDNELTHMSVPRTFLAVITFAFVIYMIPGLWGAPLNSISAFLPGLSTQDFVLSGDNNQAEAGKKYAEIFKRLPKVKGIDDWYDYDQAMAVAKKQHKPLFIDFTGWNCANCRKMEATVFPKPDVLKRLQDNFVVVQLVIDDKTDLPEPEQTVSSFDGKKNTTLGAKWLDFEITKFDSNAQPNYCIVDQSGNTVIPPQGGVIALNDFIKYLDDAVAAYHSE
jgi:thiol:disulfide interchange protein DsbD